MIGKLSGTLDHKNPPEIIIDCHGVGYEVQVPMSTFYNLPELGGKVSLLTHFVVREDAQILYGFASAPEREAFRQLIKISGVGPRTALSVLSGMSVGELAQAITLQEAGRLIKVPGIGRRGGQRGQRCAVRHFAGAAGAGLQRQRGRRCPEGAAQRSGCQRRHQTGLESAGPVTGLARQPDLLFLI